jgi:hypothetical protein
MIRFLPNGIPEGRWPFRDAAYAALRAIEQSCAAEIDLTEGTDNILITGCMRAFQQGNRRRVLDLAQSAIVSWNAELFLGAVVSSRALLESVASFHSFLTRAQGAAKLGGWAKIGRLVDAYDFFSTSLNDRKKRDPDDPPRIGQAVAAFTAATQPGSEKFWDPFATQLTRMTSA